MIEQVIAFFVGIFTNFIVWWWLFHAIVPDVKFSDSISKTKCPKSNDNKSGYKYRIKLENAGKRKIIDVEILARLRFKGIGDFTKTNTRVVDIPIESDQFLSYRIPYMNPSKEKGSIRHIVMLQFNGIEEFSENMIYPREIRKKAKNKLLLLEDLLNLGSKTTLQVLAFGYDEFSGTRKIFLSKLYTIEDIYSAPFNCGNLEIESPSNPKNYSKETYDSEDS